MQDLENTKEKNQQPIIVSEENEKSNKTERERAAENWLAEFIRKTRENIR